MPVHRLTKRAKLLSRSDVASDFAPADESWSVMGEVWADIRPLTSFERANANQVFAGANCRVTFRWPGYPVDSTLRLEVDGIAYEIQGVIDVDGEGQYIELICTRTMSAGVETTR